MKRIAFVLVSLCLFQRETFAISLEARVQALEQKWEQQQQMKIGQNAQLAETISKFDELQRDFQLVKGSLETQLIQFKQLETSTQNYYRDLEMRIQAIEQSLQLMEGTLKRTLSKVAPDLARETESFDRALEKVRAAEYTQAIQAFEQFLKQYPKGPNAPEAYYWIGECRYALKDFAQAIKDLQKFVEKNPKSEKIPKVLLKQADGFLQLSMQNEAKVFLNKLVQEYPKSPEAALAKGKLEGINNKHAPVLQSPQIPLEEKPQEDPGGGGY